MRVGRVIKRIAVSLVERVFPYGHGPAPRAPALRPDDVMLVSYPRSGSTWVRAILAGLMYPAVRLEGLRDLNRLVPDIYFGLPPLVRYSAPRIVKTHQPFAFRHEHARAELYRRNIYVARHPVDVARSFFDFQRRFFAGAEVSMARFVERFVNGAVPGNSSWQEHVLSWKSAQNGREVLFVRFEDLRAEAGAQVARLGRFLGREVSDERIEAILQQTSQAEMVRLDKARPLVQEDYEFVRRPGRARGDDTTMTDELKRLIWDRSRIAMDLLGYGPEPPHDPATRHDDAR